MTIAFTIAFTAAGTPDYSDLQQMESGRWRDVNGNSSTSAELERGASTSDEVVVTLSEDQCDEHSVGELLEIVQAEATGLVMAYLTGESEELHRGGYTFTLPQDSNRCTFTAEGETNPLAGTDEHVPTYLPYIAAERITAAATAHRPHDEIIRVEQ